MGHSWPARLQGVLARAADARRMIVRRKSVGWQTDAVWAHPAGGGLPRARPRVVVGTSLVLRNMLRFLPRARHVLRTEGLSVLLRKIRRRLGTARIQACAPPRLLSEPEPFRPVALARCSRPDVSVIIPAFEPFRLTHHCLAAVRAHLDLSGVEVIVVDDCATDDTARRLRDYEGVRVVRNPTSLGFGGSCNRAAALASGRLLVFLGHDTQVQPGWLDALVAGFEGHPDAGLIGSRLVYPDGRQQEAGAILFADGSAWSYGRLDDPARPQYSYLRAVDYCSGAAIAIPRALFQQLGGFDTLFAPACYQDADLAMRVRAADYRVYYQPTARVVHFDASGVGMNPRPDAAGMVRLQAVNRQRFRARWGAAIAGWGERGDALERLKERSARRRALVVDNYMVTPDKESGSLRMWNLLAILQGLGFKVTFAAANLEAPQPYVSQLQGRGIECLYRPYVRSVKHHLATRGRSYDLVILSRADAAAAVMPSTRRYCPNARIVYDTVDLHFLREERLAELTGDRLMRRAAAQRRRQELALIEASDAALVVSEVERDLLRAQLPRARIHLVSNIHEVHARASAFEARRDILFIGAFAHPPNSDAVRWLAREILPRVWLELPDLRCHVIGADPPADIRALAGPRLNIHGYIPDVVPFFQNCRLSVAPLRYGAGVKGKVNQSLSYGLPVVATSPAVEGMNLVDGESVLIADDPADFCAAVVRLYGDQALWRRISDGGIAVMQKHFSFDVARRSLADVVGE